MVLTFSETLDVAGPYYKINPSYFSVELEIFDPEIGCTRITKGEKKIL